ncbi:MAG TPA: FHA domain-containing protein [Acidobacteriota bacterium]
MSARLIGRTGEAAGTDFALGDDAKLGAAAGNQVRLPVTGVSRQHARIWKDGEVYYIEDSGSTNGTFVNGQRIDTFRLRHLDVVSLARYVDLIFLQDGGPSRRVHGQALQAASIEWLDGPDAGTVVDIPLGETTIGRDWSSNIAVEVSVVSKIHARLTRHGNFLTIQDLGSTNGTAVDGRDVQGVLTLNGREEVSLGGGVRFRVNVQRDPAARVAERRAVDTVDAEVFDQEWRTRLIWSPEELAEIESVRARIRSDGIGRPAAKDTEKLDDKKIEEALARADEEEPAGQRTMVAAPELLEAAAQRAAEPDREATHVGSVKDLAGPVPGDVLAAAQKAAAPDKEATQVGSVKDLAGPVPGDVLAAAQKAAAPDKEATQAGSVKDLAGPVPGDVLAAAQRAAAPDREATQAGSVKDLAGPVPGDVLAAAGAAKRAPAAGGEPAAAGEPAITGIRLEGDMGSFRLGTGDFLIGRDLAAEVWLDGEGVSRKHAMVYVTSHSVEIEDLGSSNGTRANREAVTRRRQIDDGDLLEFGGASLRLEVVRK